MNVYKRTVPCGAPLLMQSFLFRGRFLFRNFIINKDDKSNRMSTTVLLYDSSMMPWNRDTYRQNCIELLQIKYSAPKFSNLCRLQRAGEDLNPKKARDKHITLHWCTESQTESANFTNNSITKSDDNGRSMWYVLFARMAENGVIKLAAGFYNWLL